MKDRNIERNTNKWWETFPIALSMEEIVTQLLLLDSFERFVNHRCCLTIIQLNSGTVLEIVPDYRFFYTLAPVPTKWQEFLVTNYFMFHLSAVFDFEFKFDWRLGNGERLREITYLGDDLWKSLWKLVKDPSVSLKDDVTPQIGMNWKKRFCRIFSKYSHNSTSLLLKPDT